jgi:hypothetical protein
MGDGEMPAERIYTRQTEEEGTFGEHVCVGWGKGHANINLGTVHDHPQEERGVFIDIKNRGEVNQLIRALRRARDQAFGRDE